MHIRNMTIADYDAVYRLWKGTAGVGLRRLDDSREGIARFLKRNPATNFVAEEGNTLAGVLLCGQDGRRGYIYHTVVDAAFRRRGIGKALVEAVLEALEKEQIYKAALVVFCTNKTGNEFWQALGFEKREDLVYRNKSLNEENI